ncbi:hypothetical protein [Occallatibacter riparius]|uniref:Uncharacterized protein n=1 Tax=Occallatibacter riparius TaxID=1002689 RepID=A0A9J7BRE2_9BACT|nr:hypothetical protein [Occallatibacter riparius]UWZ85240.1 hypothetical protein MOP44_04680 [Occallatibacter riparius]
MDIPSIVTALDSEIARLQQARAVLAQSGGDSSSTATKHMPAKKRGGKRTLSPEARKRIAEAQKKRWAAARKQKPEASKVSSKKTIPAKKTAALPS